MSTGDVPVLEARDLIAATLPAPSAAEAPTLPRERAPVVQHSASLPRGTAINRYLVLSVLGRGGMGEVHAAYDPELDRKIAIKLLFTAHDSDDARARLLREARALGKISHPNVVQVYDVGEHHGNVFIAMELVEGASLEAFCHTTPPPAWQVVLAAYLDAARGLAAAHEKGLVHRDVKPSNLLMGRDGRVRVADFGIAKDARIVSDHREGATAALDLASPPSKDPADGSGSMPSAPMGTPLYLAPEQHANRPATPASDQYSLCLSLYEGLHGAPPFPADPSLALAPLLADLFRRKLEGVPDAPPAGSPVPAWVHRAVARGLAPRVADRHPSIEALIDALSRDPEASRRAYRRALAAAVGAGALVAAAVTGWAQRAVPADGCAHPERELAGVWDGAVATRVRAAFTASGRPNADATATRVGALLDEQAGAWTRMRREVCEAARFQPHPPLVELRGACLDRRRAQIGALTALLAQRPDAAIVDKAVQAVSGLPLISLCADAEALTARVRPPEDPAARARVAALWPQVDHLEALHTAGKYREGAALGEPLLAEITSLPYAPLRAQAQYTLSRLRDGVGDYEGAKELLRAAAASASEGRDDLVGATAWARLLFVVSERQGRYDEAAVIRSLGPTALARVHDPRTEAAWLNAEGLLHHRTAKRVEAEQAHLRALALREGALGPEHLDVAISLNNLGILYTDFRRHEDATRVLTRAIVIREKNLGPDHPEVALCQHNLGLALHHRREYEEARRALTRALAVYERAYGPDHPELVMPLTSLGGLLMDIGDALAAEAVLTRVAPLAERALGPAHPRTLRARLFLGLALVRLGRVDAGCAIQEEVLLAWERAVGPVHPDLSGALKGVAACAMARRQPDRAIALLERARRAGPLTEGVELPLAEALWTAGKERPRARALVEEALAHHRQVHDEVARARAERWLAAHPLP